MTGCFGGAVVLMAFMIDRPAVRMSWARERSGKQTYVEVDHRVEVPTERDRVRHLAEPLDADGGVEAFGEARNILQGDRNRPTVTDFHVGHDESAGVSSRMMVRGSVTNHAGLDEHRRHAHRAVTAHRQASTGLDVDDAVVTVGS